MVSGSTSLLYSRFFSPFLHSTSSLSVSQEYLALPDGAGRFRRGVSDPALLRIPLDHITLPIQGFHLLRLTFPGNSYSVMHIISWSYNPTMAVTIVVWAIPSSLATTLGITVVFFSSGYLDVSVPRVCFLSDTWSSTKWVAPFGNLRIKSYLRILGAYRSLSRPSSPLRA